MSDQLIYKKIGEIMKEISPISKDKKNTQQNYNFRGIDDAMDMFSPLMAKHGVFPVTEKIEDVVLSENVVSKSGSAGWRTVRRYTFRFYAEDGSFVSTISDGEAIDYGDKSSNKAYSTAYREALWKMFVVPFKGSDDIENTSHELKSEPTVQYAPQNAPKATVAPKKTPFEVATEKISKAVTAEELATLSAQVTESTKLNEEEKITLQESIEAKASLIP